MGKSKKTNAKMLQDALERAEKGYDPVVEARKARARLRRERDLGAIRDGVKQRAWTQDNGRAKASKRACRGRVRFD